MTLSRKAGGALTLTLYFIVYVDYDAVAESGRSPVSWHSTRFSLSVENELADVGRPFARPNSQARTGTGKKVFFRFFPVHLATSRIGNHTRLIPTLLKVLTLHTRVWIDLVRLPILLVVSSTAKMNISLFAFAPIHTSDYLSSFRTKIVKVLFLGVKITEIPLHSESLLRAKRVTNRR